MMRWVIFKMAGVDEPASDDERGNSRPSPRPLDSENPGVPSHLGPIKQLYSATGYNLAIDSEGRVYGTREPFHAEAVLEIRTNEPGVVLIKGYASQRYVAMNDQGKVYGEEDPESPNCTWMENYESGYNIYEKMHAPNWFLGIKKSGRPKRGDKTRRGQKAVRFLPRPVKSTD